MQAGSDITVRAKAADTRGGLVRDATSVTAWFWEPGADPARDTPCGSASLSWSEPGRTWTANVPTLSWSPGQWHVQVVVEDGQVPSGTARGVSPPAAFTLVRG
jgi:hypothetical protein